MRYLKPEEIENKANELISDYEKKYGLLKPPIPVERIVENQLDLLIEWNSIPEKTNEIIYAGLAPTEKKIVFNEKRLEKYNKTDGLYNTVLGHEAGHWVLHCQYYQSVNQSSFLGTGIVEKFLYRSSGPNSSEEWQAHTFMGCLMLPMRFLKQDIISENILDWTSLYHIKEKYDVTISSVVIRLEKLGLIYVEDRKIYKTKGEANGQVSMF